MPGIAEIGDDHVRVLELRGRFVAGARGDHAAMAALGRDLAQRGVKDAGLVIRRAGSPSRANFDHPRRAAWSPRSPDEGG